MAIKVSIEELKKNFSVVYKFIKKNKLSKLEIGRYFLSDGIYANVDEYNTKPIEEGKYEAHKRYLDIQILIDGNEHIYVDSLNNLQLNEPYNIERDIEFYKRNYSGSDYDMHELECLILYPEDGHMPCINDECRLNKKIVFKVPLSYFKNVKCLIMDVDGTLTDGKIYMGQDGEEFKAFNIKDGYGIANILKKHKIIPVILTGRNSKIVDNRAKELGIKYIYQGVNDKLAMIDEIASLLEIDLCNISYVGDDDNDLPCIEYVKENDGLTACPKDAGKNVLKRVDYISSYDGGQGAVRQFIEWICYEK